MKKLLFIFCVSFLTPNLSAQDFGVKAGMSFSWMGGATVDDLLQIVGADANYYNPGFALGGFAQFGESNMRFTAEVLYLQKGFDYSIPFWDQEISSRLVFNYLESNAMGNFYISDNSSINGGVYIGYLASATTTTTTGGTSSTEDLEFASEDRRVDFGANFGVSLYLTEALQLDARYGHGLLSISEDEEVFNRTIQFTIGLKL
jgi:membrane-associated protease RseP (regulator of RpoE activity)